MDSAQLYLPGASEALAETSQQTPRFPPTRYQGSKRKLAADIVQAVSDLSFTTVLDLFGGTGSVAYAFKRAGKQVTYNDILAFNHQIGLALIENQSVTLADDAVESICRRDPGCDYDDLIEREFEGIYFTTEENRWLDVAVQNVRRMADRYERALAWFALLQAAIVKRPYNLFHRKNLYMRTADVQRSFGNKASWDRSFPDHFRAFVSQANAAVFDSGEKCHANHQDALTVEPGCDLVYIDTPYINASGTGVDYRDFYHFLEGMIQYDQWPAMIDHASKHRRLQRTPDPWSNPRTTYKQFEQLFHRFRDGILVVSYRADGTPTIAELENLLREVKGSVETRLGNSYQYALSTNRRSKEVLLVGR